MIPVIPDEYCVTRKSGCAASILHVVQTPLAEQEINGGVPPVGQSARTPQHVGTGFVAAFAGKVGHMLLRASLMQLCNDTNEYMAKIAMIMRITITKIKDHVGTPFFLASTRDAFDRLEADGLDGGDRAVVLDIFMVNHKFL